MGIDYINGLCDFPKKEILIDYKYFWEAFSKKLPKKEI